MKIGELSRRSGLSTHTIRYYEKIGLLPFAHRDEARQRDYDLSILTWVEFLGHLKATGMPLKEMLLYAQMRFQGNETIPDRRILLEKHRHKVERHMAELQDNLALLNRKISAYLQIEQEIEQTEKPAQDWDKRFHHLAKSRVRTD